MRAMAVGLVITLALCWSTAALGQPVRRVPEDVRRAVVGCWAFGDHARIELRDAAGETLRATHVLDVVPPGRRGRRFDSGVSYDARARTLSFSIVGRIHEGFAVAKPEASKLRVWTYSRRNPREQWRWTGNQLLLSRCAQRGSGTSR